MGKTERAKLSEAQKEAIDKYNLLLPGHAKVNKRYCAERAQWLNDNIFAPAEVDLLPVPPEKKVEKAQRDARRNSSQPTASTLSMSGRKSGSAAAQGFTFNVSMTSDDFADPIRDIITEQLEGLKGEFFTKTDSKQLLKQFNSRLLSFEQDITRHLKSFEQNITMSIASLLVSFHLSPSSYHHAIYHQHKCFAAESEGHWCCHPTPQAPCSFRRCSSCQHPQEHTSCQRQGRYTSAVVISMFCLECDIMSLITNLYLQGKVPSGAAAAAGAAKITPSSNKVGIPHYFVCMVC